MTTVAILINEYFVFYNPSLALAKEHLVQIPEVHTLTSFSHLFTFPDIQYLRLPEVWFSGVAIAIIASLETLLSRFYVTFKVAVVLQTLK